ncbi:ATP-dependent DNA helicase RecG [Elusimicrobiota bacterium]
MKGLEKPIQFFKGVGPKKAQLLSKLGITNIGDILAYFPREYDDRRKVSSIVSVMDGQRVTLLGKVESSDVSKLSKNLSVYKVAINDGTGTANACFFRKSNPYHKHDVYASLKKIFKNGEKVFINGISEQNFAKNEIKVDEYEVFLENNTPLHFNKIVPIYPLTKRLSQKWLRGLIGNIVNDYCNEWAEILPDKFSAHFMKAQDAVQQIHFPDNFQNAENARQRLAFDEFLLLELALAIARAREKRVLKIREYALKKTLLTPFREKLEFEFTNAQKKVINEIFNDMQNKKPMNRLLMGDVGSGKTVVALSAVLLAIESGFQAALLAPTEILAEQHYITISNTLSGLPIKTALLTSKITSKKQEREKLISQISSGKIDLVIGTHAILEKDVLFKNLALVVIDEQHRFGVRQRASLQKKGARTDVLVMTATPIPRTLALTVYGDLDVSTIDKMPPGRMPIKTLHTNPDFAYNLTKEEIKKGHQAYIVYPLVEESDKVELKAAVREAQSLSKTVFKDYRVGLLHGQMKAGQKEETMLKFRDKKFDILIATTVIEVGIDIPNATVMIIEHANRFGLATLHQLRGRVGRGTNKSYCVLVGEAKTDQSKQRINVMLSTCDGFKIAEEDLHLRGPGEIFGTIQHGLPQLRAGNIVSDLKLIEKSRETAKNILANDFELAEKQNTPIKSELLRLYGEKFGLFRVG